MNSAYEISNQMGELIINQEQGGIGKTEFAFAWSSSLSMMGIACWIILRHVLLAMKNDEELRKLLIGVTLAHGDVLPNIKLVLLPKKTQATKELKSPSKATMCS
ncbi:Histone H2A [Spatholobus suberectus]|nr:Histone H2A [Spatholobus suberectus]